MTKFLSKFGEQQLVMVNYACDFNQSETGKYFELIMIIAINDSKLDESIMEGEVNICGYDIVRRDRKRSGGGVFFFVKNSINFSTCRDLDVDDLQIFA